MLAEEQRRFGKRETRSTVIFSAKNLNIMVFSCESCLGLGLNLSHRKQFCKVNGVDSNVGEIAVGVPQGSCLDHLLFIIYINDLPQAIQHSSVTISADDTSLCHQSRDLTQLNEATNSDLKTLET